MIASSKLVGIDLFTGEAPQKSLIANKPVFLCICAGGFGLTRDKNMVEQYKKNPTTNQTSIIALINWLSGRYSYYCGGDGYPDAAAKYVQVKPLITVTVAKLDHHGSSGEFAKGIIQQMSPRKVIVTPGTTHGHPSMILCSFYPLLLAERYPLVGYDVVLALHECFESSKFNERGKSLYSTRSPYWATEEALGGKDINISKARNTTKQPFKNIYKKSIEMEIERNDSEWGAKDLIEETYIDNNGKDYTPFSPRSKPSAYDQTKPLQPQMKKDLDGFKKYGNLTAKEVEKEVQQLKNGPEEPTDHGEKEDEEIYQVRRDFADAAKFLWNDWSPNKVKEINEADFYMLYLLSADNDKDGTIETVEF
jgi:hypothetical protein